MRRLVLSGPAASVIASNGSLCRGRRVNNSLVRHSAVLCACLRLESSCRADSSAEPDGRCEGGGAVEQASGGSDSTGTLKLGLCLCTTNRTIQTVKAACRFGETASSAPRPTIDNGVVLEIIGP